MGCRVNSPGPYGHSEKWTLIAAVSPVWVIHFRFEKTPGTKITIFNNFMRACNQVVATPRPTLRRTYLMDNLLSHKHPVVYNTVAQAGPRMLFRTPYCPWDGPIEYVFAQLENELKNRMYRIRSERDLRQQVQIILARLAPFDATFRHCGYL